MQIDDTTLKTIVAKAIFDGITPEQRQELLSKAIQSLLIPVKPSYGSSPATSPLQDIFDNEVRNIARDLIREEFKTNEATKTLIGGIVAKTIVALSADENVASEMASAIGAALSKANSSRY